MTAVIGRHRGNPDCGVPAFFVVGSVCNPLLKVVNCLSRGLSICSRRFKLSPGLGVGLRMLRSAQSGRAKIYKAGSYMTMIAFHSNAAVNPTE